LISGAKVNMANAVFLRNKKNLQKKFIFSEDESNLSVNSSIFPSYLYL